MAASKQATVLETVVGGLKPVPEGASDEVTELLDRLAKYARMSTPDTELPPFARIADGEDIVAVYDTGKTQVSGIIHRRLVGSTDLGDGKTAREYQFIGARLGRGPAFAQEALRQVQGVAEEVFAVQASLVGDLMDPNEEPF